MTHLVTLKTLSSLSALNAERPKEPALSWKLTQNTSKTEPVMTMTSKRLKLDWKKAVTPRAYIRMPISKMKAERKKNSAQSAKKD